MGSIEDIFSFCISFLLFRTLRCRFTLISLIKVKAHPKQNSVQSLNFGNITMYLLVYLLEITHFETTIHIWEKRFLFQERFERILWALGAQHWDVHKRALSETAVGLWYCRADLHNSGPRCCVQSVCSSPFTTILAMSPYSIKGQVKFPQTYTHVEGLTTHTTHSNPPTPPPPKPDSTGMTRGLCLCWTKTQSVEMMSLPPFSWE